MQKLQHGVIQPEEIEMSRRQHRTWLAAQEQKMAVKKKEAR